MTTVYVKPREGARIRQPDRGHRVMDAEGDHVPRDVYYQRLIMCGDLVECDAPPASQDASPDAAPSPPALPSDDHA